MRQIFVVVLLLSLVLLNADPHPVLAQDSFTSENFGFTVSWTAEWHLDWEDSRPGFGTSIRLSASDFYIEYHAYVSGGQTPADAVQLFVEFRRESEPELVVQQVFQPGGTVGPVPAVIVFDSVSGVRMREVITAQTVVGPDQMLIIALGYPESTSPRIAEIAYQGVSLSFHSSDTVGSQGGTATCSGYSEWRTQNQSHVERLHAALDKAANGMRLPGLFRTGEIGLANDSLSNLLSDLMTAITPPPVAGNASSYFMSAVSKYAAALRELSMQDLTNYSPVITPSIQTHLSDAEMYFGWFESEVTWLDQQCNYVAD